MPPRNTLLPAARRSSEISVVVVVLPSLPVTAYVLQGQSRKNSSISLVTSVPFAAAEAIPGISGRTAGERNSSSSVISSR